MNPALMGLVPHAVLVWCRAALSLFIWTTATFGVVACASTKSPQRTHAFWEHLSHALRSLNRR
jgi:hypothetical protein